MNGQQRNAIEEEMHRVFESASRVSAVYALAERGLSATAIASRLARKSILVSPELVLRTIQENGWSWHPEFVKEEDPLTARIRKLIAVGYSPWDIARFIGESNETVEQRIVSSGLGYAEDGDLYIYPKCVKKSAMVLYDEDMYAWSPDISY